MKGGRYDPEAMTTDEHELADRLVLIVIVVFVLKAVGVALLLAAELPLHFGQIGVPGNRQLFTAPAQPLVRRPQP